MSSSGDVPGNVFGIGTRQPVLPESEPVPEVVALLEDLLERARTGEIRAVGYGLATRGSFASAWTSEGTEYNKAKLVAAVSLLSHRLLTALDERGSA